MVCLDADLRVSDICTVTHSFSGDFNPSELSAIDGAIPADDETLPQLDTRFVALGYSVVDASGHPEGFDWPRVSVVEELLGRRGIRLLGIQISDHEKWASTGPMYSFASYSLGDDLPRAVVIPGPHPFATCECDACAPRRPFPRSGPRARSV